MATSSSSRPHFRSRIIGTGGWAPPRVVTNDEMKQFVDTNDEWITQRSGIKTRHLIDFEGQLASSDMATEAAKLAIEMAGITALDIELIVVATVTPDMKCPSTAVMVQDKIGARNAYGFDVSAACAGSGYALSVADKFVRSGSVKRALVIGVETMSTITNWKDRGTCVLFGDAAGAWILEAVVDEGDNNAPGLIDVDLYSDGTTWQHIYIPAGGSKKPMTEQDVIDRQDRVVMNGREVYKFAVRQLSAAAEKVLADNGYTAADVDVVCAHQANLRIIEAIAERTNIPMDKFVINIDRYGNTSSASLPTTFDEGRRTGRMKPGSLVLMMSIGAGMTWTAGLYRA
ncbi:MAG TPA: beta-ketoacyl-ACP synthase III [Myxococcota bacterium]